MFYTLIFFSVFNISPIIKYSSLAHFPRCFAELIEESIFMDIKIYLIFYYEYTEVYVFHQLLLFSILK